MCGAVWERGFCLTGPLALAIQLQHTVAHGSTGHLQSFACCKRANARGAGQALERTRYHGRFACRSWRRGERLSF